MRQRKTLQDKNAEQIIRLFEESSKLGWLSSDSTKLNYDELMNFLNKPDIKEC